MSVSFASSSSTGAANEQRPSRRAESKAKTRRKVLQSAKELFVQHGYEGATMREIAAHAGLSTGALFANFTDKADLFNAVMAEDFRAQNERMKTMAKGDGPAEQVIADLMRIGYEFHTAQLPLLQAAISVSWTQGLPGDLGERPVKSAVIARFTEVLKAAAARGDVRGDADIGLCAQMLWDSYVANYRHAIFAKWGVEELVTHARRQIDLIMKGLKA